jgi:DNA-binding CsgD family transcriptional regulator
MSYSQWLNAEEADFYRLLKIEHKLTYAQIAAKIGTSYATVFQSLNPGYRKNGISDDVRLALAGLATKLEQGEVVDA